MAPNLSNTRPFDKTGAMTLTIQKYRLILASNSPRRRYLLRQAGIEFDVIPSHFDESRVVFHDPFQYVQTLSQAKAGQVAAQYPDCWIIGADTIVLIHGKVLGKPRDRSGARAMLEQLSGQTHQVYTGFTICCDGLLKRFTDVVVTDVTFKKLTNDEIKWYSNTDEPFDKAGAYAIQGLGTFLVQRINGSYTNVVGLPVCEVIGHLIKEGVIRMQGGS
jgi:septum formation protein